jgi:hypothetical protein
VSAEIVGRQSKSLRMHVEPLPAGIEVVCQSQVGSEYTNTLLSEVAVDTANCA